MRLQLTTGAIILFLRVWLGRVETLFFMVTKCDWNQMRKVKYLKFGASCSGTV
jgi:hypothetical protein